MAKVIKNAISSEYLRYKIDEDISIYEGRDVYKRQVYSFEKGILDTIKWYTKML